MTCWIVTEGMAGTENQCLGVAAALGLAPEVKRIGLKQPWRSLSPFLGFEHAGIFSPPLTPPWPDLVIAAGRKSIAAARFIKKASLGRSFIVQIQDPRISTRAFDLVAVPAHDGLRGENVIVTVASPNRITPAALAAARARFPQFERLKSPRVAVLIGGNSKAHQLTQGIMRDLSNQLAALDAGLMVTASRRTGPENIKILNDILGDALKNSGNRDIYFWDGTGENPYFAMLAAADFIVVTGDSASMLSDAGTTGKPVYMVRLAGGSARFDRLHDNLRARGVMRDFEGRLEHWDYQPLNDAGMIAAEIRKRLDYRP